MVQTYRLLLACGAAGAILAIVGDNIMLWQAASMEEVERRGMGLVAYVSPERIRIGSIFGVPGFFLQSVGVLGIYCCLRRSSPLSKTLSSIVAGLFGFALFAGLAWHVSYPPLGAALALEGLSESLRDALSNRLIELLADFYFMSIYAFGAGSLLFAAMLIAGWSSFPRWFVFVSPFLIQALLQGLSGVLPPAVAVGLYVSNLNCALLAFFVMAFFVAGAPYNSDDAEID
ncbi:MAG: DUF6796 family protein [Pseudomonadota bacterium]